MNWNRSKDACSLSPHENHEYRVLLAKNGTENAFYCVYCLLYVKKTVNGY
jgi:hypothetical protein